MTTSNSEGLYVDADVKISLLAPSRAGKTTLLSAIFSEVQGDAARTQYRFGATGIVKRKMAACIDDFRSQFDIAKSGYLQGKPFFIPSMLPSVGQTEYAFYLQTLQTDFYVSQKRATIQFSFRDYPGGLINTPEAIPEDLREYIEFSRIMFVPIPTDILQEYYNPNVSEEVRAKAKILLQLDKISQQLLAWVANHIEKREHCYLCFVPVKCEQCFNDNGGTKDNTQELFTYVKRAYLDAILASNLSIDEYVQIEIRAVDTFGISEYDHMELKDDEWTSYFRVRDDTFKTMFPKPKVKGASALFASVLHFTLSDIAHDSGVRYENLSEIINNRGTIERIGKAILGILGKRDVERSKMKEYLSKQKSFLCAAVEFSKVADIPQRCCVVNQISAFK